MEKGVEHYEEDAELLKAIAHPIRLCIINGLLDRNEATVSDMQICLKIPQSTLSQHIAKLKSAKIIKGIRDGKNINYTVINDKAKDIVKIMKYK